MTTGRAGRLVAATGLALVATCAACAASPAPAPGASSTVSPVVLETSASSTSVANADSTGAATITALGASVEAEHAGVSTPVDGEASATVGDSVRTDAAGLGEVRFADDSLLRVGNNSSIILREMTAAAVQRTRIDLIAGDTWHEVTKLTAPGAAYEVATPVGVAAVRGTTFAVSCTENACVVTVLEGIVRFTPTGAPPVDVTTSERLVVASGGAPATPVTMTPAQLAADPWIARNAPSAPTAGTSASATGTASAASGGACDQILTGEALSQILGYSMAAMGSPFNDPDAVNGGGGCGWQEGPLDGRVARLYTYVPVLGKTAAGTVTSEAKIRSESLINVGDAGSYAVDNQWLEMRFAHGGLIYQLLLPPGTPVATGAAVGKYVAGHVGG